MAIIKRDPVTKNMTSEEASAFTGYFGQITSTQGVKGIVLHDGVTPGGFVIEDANTLYIEEIIPLLSSSEILNGWKVLTGPIILEGGDDDLFISELPTLYGIPGTKLEPNSLILLRIFRDADHPNDTFDEEVLVSKTCLHYEASRFGTLNRLPDYNTNVVMS